MIEKLEQIIKERKETPKEGSYTNTLLDNKPKAAQKVGEEAVEVIVAALGQTREDVVYETADLIYHLLVLLRTEDIQWIEILDELESRHG